jgi:hypothetical protein
MGVGNADQWPAYLFIGITHCFQKRAMGGPFNSFFNKVASHDYVPDLQLWLLGFYLNFQNDWFNMILFIIQWWNLRRAMPGVKENEHRTTGDNPAPGDTGLESWPQNTLIIVIV